MTTLKITSSPSFWKPLRHRMFGAPDHILEVGERRRIELLAGFAFLLMVSTGTGTFATFAANPGQIRASSISLGITFILVLTAYILSRTKFYAIGSVLLTTALSLTAFMTIIGGTDNPSSTLFSSIPIALLLASALLSVRGLAITLIFNVIGAILLPSVAPYVDPAVMTSPVGIIITFGVLLIIVGNVRNAIEADRLAELTQSNKELDSLRESLELRVQERARNLSEALRIANLGNWEYDFTKDEFTFNDDFYAMMRTTAEREGGYTMNAAQYTERFVYQEDAPLVGIEIGKSIETIDPNFSTELEHRVYFGDGELGYVNVRFRIQKDVEGRTVKSFGANQNITERKQAEVALAQNEDQLSEALRIARLGNWEYDFVKDEFTFNDDFYTVMRTTAERERGYKMNAQQYTERFVYPEDAPIVGIEIGKSIETTDPNFSTQVDHRVIFGDGEVGYITVRFRIQKDAEGRTVKSFGANQDITERKEAEETLEKRATELETVAEVSKAVTTIQDVDALLQQVVDLTKERFHLYHAHIYLLNEARDTLVLRAGAGDAGRIMTAQGRTIPLDHLSSLVARAGRTRDAVIVNDVSQAPDFLPNPLLPDTKSEMALPLVIGEQVLGVLDIQSDQLDYFTENDQRIQTILADQIAIAISNAAQYTQEQAQAQRLTDLVENTAGFSNPQIGMDALMILIIRNAIHLLEADDAGLWLAIRQDEIELKANRDHDHLVGMKLKTGEGLSGRVFESGEVLRVDDYAAWSGRALQETSIQVSMAVPLIWQGKPIGTLALTREHAGHLFNEEDERIAQLFASQVASAIENLRAYERTQETLQNLDTLTRRLTREAWQEFLTEAKRARVGYVFEGDRLAPLDENGHFQQNQETTFVQPVLLHGERIGQLVASEPEIEATELQAILAAVSQGLSAHLENLRLTEEAERRVSELDMINDIGQALTSDVDLQKILETVVDKLSRAFRATNTYVALYDENRQMIHIPYMFAHGQIIVNEPSFPFGEGINSTIIKTRQSIFINQDSERRLRDLGAVPTITTGSMAKSFMGVPLIAGEKVIGILSVQDTTQEGRFTSGDLELLSTIASSVAVAVQNAQLFAETQKRAEREAMVNQIGQKIQSSTTVQGALQTAIQELGLVLKARRTAVELTPKPEKEVGS